MLLSANCPFIAFAMGQPLPPTRREHQNVEARINALLAKMTLAEKLGQLQQLDGEANGNFRPEHLEMVRQGFARFDPERAWRSKNE